MRRRGQHTTIIEGLEEVLRTLERLDGIDVSPGRITTGLPAGHHILKLHQRSGGVEAVFRGTRTKQVLHIYGNGEMIQQELLKLDGERMSVKIAE